MGVWDNLANMGIGMLGGIGNMALGKKTMDMQLQNQKELNEHQQQMQLDMWDKTNYKAQVDQMKKAGLNVGLMYEGGGTGGSTQSSVGGSAQGMEAPDIMGMMLQAQKLKSEIKVNEASANKLNAEATKTGGVDTEKGYKEIENLSQGIQNQKAQEKLTDLETSLKGVEYDVKNATINDSIGIVRNELNKGLREIYILEQQGIINNAEANISKEKWALQLNNLSADTILKKSQNQNVIENTAKTKEETSILFKDYLIRSKNANTQEKSQLLQDYRAEMQQKLQESGLEQQETKMYLDATLSVFSSLLGVEYNPSNTTTEYYDGSDKSYTKKTVKK